MQKTLATKCHITNCHVVRWLRENYMRMKNAFSSIYFKPKYINPDNLNHSTSQHYVLQYRVNYIFGCWQLLLWSPNNKSSRKLSFGDCQTMSLWRQHRWNVTVNLGVGGCYYRKGSLVATMRFQLRTKVKLVKKYK